MKPFNAGRFAFLSVVCGAMVTPYLVRAAPEPPAATQPAGPLTYFDIKEVHNTLKWTGNLYSGACPDGNAGYKALAALGIKTIVDVDGAAPNALEAKKYGMRSVHIPVEYSGIAREDALRIIRAVRDLPGPVFIHCHHGKHRSPAAAAMVAISLGGYDREKARAALTQAGTGANYKGLWADVLNFTPATPTEIEAAEHAFVEKAPLKPMTAAMVTIDGHFDALKAYKAAGFKQPGAHADLDPAQEALLLREAYTELGRTAASKARGADFLARLLTAQTAAGQLEDAIRAGDTEKSATAFQASEAACGSCHRLYRD